jgi:hypothetical protein
LVAVASQGWVEILTDLLTELSEMASYKAIGQVMQRRMLNLQRNSALMRVCFMEAQFHPELREQIQTEVIGKMIDVAEAFFQTAMDRGVYRPMNARMVARVFLGMFTVAGFSQETLGDTAGSAQSMKELAECLTDIFLNGVLATGDIHHGVGEQKSKDHATQGTVAGMAAMGDPPLHSPERGGGSDVFRG